VSETEEPAVEAVHNCIKSFVAGKVGSDAKLAKADPIQALSGRVITIRVDISSPPKT